MHPHGTTSINLPARLRVPLRPSKRKYQNSESENVSTKEPIHLLSVGRIEPTPLAGNALSDESNFAISTAIDYRELWLQSTEESIDIALLHNSLCSFQLEQAARLVRCRWPMAKILIIRSGEVGIDRAVFDDCLPPSINSEVLLQRVFNLIHSLPEGRAPHGDR